MIPALECFIAFSIFFPIFSRFSKCQELKLFPSQVDGCLQGTAFQPKQYTIIAKFPQKYHIYIYTVQILFDPPKNGVPFNDPLLLLHFQEIPILDLPPAIPHATGRWATARLPPLRRATTCEAFLQVLSISHPHRGCAIDGEFGCLFIATFSFSLQGRSWSTTPRQKQGVGGLWLRCLHDILKIS